MYYASYYVMHCTHNTIIWQRHSLSAVLTLNAPTAILTAALGDDVMCHHLSADWRALSRSWASSSQCMLQSVAKYIQSCGESVCVQDMPKKDQSDSGHIITLSSCSVQVCFCAEIFSTCLAQMNDCYALPCTWVISILM